MRAAFSFASLERGAVVRPPKARPGGRGFHGASQRMCWVFLSPMDPLRLEKVRTAEDNRAASFPGEVTAPTPGKLKRWTLETSCGDYGCDVGLRLLYKGSHWSTRSAWERRRRVHRTTLLGQG